MKSDPPRAEKNPDESDVDELPSDSAPPAADGLSLEEQIAALTSLEIDDGEGESSGKAP